jgi:hypothetical protein
LHHATQVHLLGEIELESSWTLAQTITSFLELENFSLLFEPTRHFNIDVFTFFYISMNKGSVMSPSLDFNPSNTSNISIKQIVVH